MFDTQRFIREIERRPAIYDLGSDEYADRAAKMTAWDQVCEVMIPKWRYLNDEDKNNEEKVLRSKWRNIRDYFMKELKLQETRKRGPAGRKRKKYMYFDQLLFLLPNAEKRKRGHHELRAKSDLMADDSAGGAYDLQLKATSKDEKEEEGEDYSRYVAEYPGSICEASLTAGSDEFGEVMSSSSEQQQRRATEPPDDYDRMFLLSLLPIMRRVPEERKLELRIVMQQALADAIRPLPGFA